MGSISGRAGTLPRLWLLPVLVMSTSKGTITVAFGLGQRNTVTQRVTIVLRLSMLLVVIGGVACSRQPYKLLDIQPTPFAIPNGYYTDIAWLEPSVMAMDYLPNLDTHNTETRLMIFDSFLGFNYLLPDEIPQGCHETRYGRINRLPSGLLGYLWECIPQLGVARDFRLHQWDQANRADQELYRYPIPFEATAFSFAPAMDNWLQERSGDGLFNKLYFVASDESLVHLLESSFSRAGHPSWLPDGRIIFAGTPQLPESGTNLFSGLPGINADLREPWTIYLTDLPSLLNGEVGEDDILLSDIQYIEAVKVSPNGKNLTFLGTIEQNQGLWLYRLETGELTRIWAGFGPYDWSPMGDELIVLLREPEAEIFRGRPAIIKLPDSLVD